MTAQVSDASRIAHFEAFSADRSAALVVTRRGGARAAHVAIKFRTVGNERDTAGRVLLVADRLALTSRELESRSADSRSCPALWPVLLSAEAIDAPTPHLPGAEPQTVIQLDMNPTEPISEDAIFTFSSGARFMPGNWSGSVQFSGGSFSPLGQWVQTAEAALESCWSTPQPLEPERPAP